MEEEREKMRQEIRDKVSVICIICDSMVDWISTSDVKTTRLWRTLKENVKDKKRCKDILASLFLSGSKAFT